jgi:succinate dehydrogenase hydrophobic anchor subunit
MTRSLLIRGMLVGLAAGVLAFVFARIFGEPQVQHAIDFEDHLAALAHEPAEPELVSRGMQRSLGLLTGTAFMGVAIGGIFSLVYAYAYGRIGNMSPRLTALALAAAGFFTVILVPFTKYPANPPTIGNPDTITKRTVLYILMIAISIFAAIAARRIWSAYVSRFGAWNAALIAGAAFLVVIGAAELILPRIHETPAGFPADVLYRFRLASLGINLTLWTTIGLGFGVAAERLLAPVTRRSTSELAGATVSSR